MGKPPNYLFILFVSNRIALDKVKYRPLNFWVSLFCKLAPKTSNFNHKNLIHLFHKFLFVFKQYLMDHYKLRYNIKKLICNILEAYRDYVYLNADIVWTSIINTYCWIINEQTKNKFRKNYTPSFQSFDHYLAQWALNSLQQLLSFPISFLLQLNLLTLSSPLPILLESCQQGLL